MKIRRLADITGDNPDRSYLFSILGVLLLTIGSALYLTLQDYRYFVEESKEEIIRQSQQIALLTEKYFEKYQDIFKSITHAPCVIERDAEACSQFFEKLNQLFPTVENFAATDRNGRFFASGQPFNRENPPNINRLAAFQALASGASRYIMNPHIGPISGEHVTGIVIPLRTETGAFDGAIGASLKMAEIKQIWNGTLEQVKAGVFIFDRDQNLIAESQRAEKLLAQSKITLERLTSALQKRADQQRTPNVAGYELYRTRSLPDEWTVLALIPPEIAFSDYLAHRSYFEISGAILALLLGLTTIALFRDSLSRARLKETEQKLHASNRELRTRAALEQSEQRYQELFQNAPVGLWEDDFSAAIAYVQDLDGQGVSDLAGYFDNHPEELKEIAARVIVRDVNRAALQLHRANAKDQLLGSLDKILDENSYPFFAREVIAFAQGKHQIEFQGEVSTLEGERRIVIVQAFRLGDPGDFRRVLIASSDITQLALTEEALRRSQKMEAIGKIAGGIAHDFNNILGIVIGNLDLLKLQFRENEKLVKRLNIASTASLRAADLTRQLLSFSRQQTQDNAPTDVNAGISELKNLVSRSVTPAIEIEYRLANNLWRANINPGDLKDALLNLVLNARDAMPEGGRITIATSNRTIREEGGDGPPGDYVELTMSDTGCGIPPLIIDRIFEPFFSTKPQGKGTGLGLSMVFGFVKRSNGEMSVSSTPGAGTCVSLLLPRAVQPVTSPQPVESPADGHREVTDTILVVDDEKELLDLAKRYLGTQGYTVLTASSAAEALCQLEQHPAVDLLFTDILMPGGMDGYELGREAISRYPSLKLLFTSGFTEPDTRMQTQFPASQLLNKPYTAAALFHKLHQLLHV